jgi:Tfp pilus assembly protein PilW
MTMRRNFIAGASSKGMTLVELVITQVIVLLLMGTIVSVLFAFKSLYQASVSHSQNRQELQVAFSNVALELRDSDYDTFTDGTAGSPKAFSFLSAVDRYGNFTTDAAGAPAWQKYVIFYIPVNSTRLLRKEVYGTFSGALSPSALAAYCDGAGTVVSTSVIMMRCVPDMAIKSCRLSIMLQICNHNGKVDQQSGSMTVFFKN